MKTAKEVSKLVEDIVNGSNTLTTKFSKTFNGVNYLSIKLNSWDTYDLDFGNLSGNNVRRVVYKTDVSADALQDVFSKVTGLATHL